MYTVPQYKIEIRLIDQNRVVKVYPDYDIFISSIKYYFVEQHVVTTFKDWPERWFDFWKFGETFTKYIVRDKFGSVFTPTEILQDIRSNTYHSYNLHMWFLRRLDFTYRRTPVPFTGNKNWSFHNYYKVPRIMQEKRWNIAHKEYVRGKRRTKHLPDPRDDHQRGDIHNRKNWKSRRKTQWK
jgi:hypothetical protein